MKEENSKAVLAYKKFDKKRLIISYIVLLSLVIDMVLIFIGIKVYSVSSKLLFYSLIALFILTAITVPVVICIRKRGNALKEAAYKITKEYKRSGVYKEIWDEYESNGFNSLLNNIGAKKRYIDAEDNTIEVSFTLNKEDCVLVIDEKACYICIGEESDTQKETEISLAQISDVPELYSVIYNFVAQAKHI